MKKLKHKHTFRPAIHWFGVFVCDDCRKMFTRKLSFPDFEYEEIVLRTQVAKMKLGKN